VKWSRSRQHHIYSNTLTLKQNLKGLEICACARIPQYVPKNS
jgi:hypothetical protein